MDADDFSRAKCYPGLIPGYTLKPQGCLSDVPIFFLQILERRSKLNCNAAESFNRILHIQREIWGTGKDTTWHICVKGEDQPQTIHKSTTEAAAQVACDLW